MKRTIGMLVLVGTVLLGVQTVSIAKTTKPAAKAAACDLECCRPCSPEACPAPCVVECPTDQGVAKKAEARVKKTHARAKKTDAREV